MTIRDILRQKGSEVVTIQPGRTILEAIRRLVDHRIGALVVTRDHGSIVGIITERDILRESAEHCEHVHETRVREIMTTDVIIGLPDDDLDYVMGIMTRNRIRHLPVLDGQQLAGIISIGDVVNADLRRTEFENRTLKDYIQGVTR